MTCHSPGLAPLYVVPLQGAAASEYRALAARASYLAQDRADIQFAAKECKCLKENINRNVGLQFYTKNWLKKVNINIVF